MMDKVLDSGARVSAWAMESVVEAYDIAHEGLLNINTTERLSSLSDYISKYVGILTNLLETNPEILYLNISVFVIVMAFVFIILVRSYHKNPETAVSLENLEAFDLAKCACLSGERQLVRFLLKKGADIHATTTDGDSALYLATFGVLNLAESLGQKPDTLLLEELVDAGCEVNAQNNRGYTPLHRAAARGNIPVIKSLLAKGADPYKTTTSGIYPIDLATNAGHLEAAELVLVDLDHGDVWDVVEPHTPTRVRLGLQSPGKKHLLESTAVRSPGPNFTVTRES